MAEVEGAVLAEAATTTEVVAETTEAPTTMAEEPGEVTMVVVIMVVEIMVAVLTETVVVTMGTVDTPLPDGRISPDTLTNLQSNRAGGTGNLARLLTGVRNRRPARGRTSSPQNETVASLKNC